MIATDLEPAIELEFRTFVAKRLESSTLSLEQGTLYTLDFHLESSPLSDALPICYCEYLTKRCDTDSSLLDHAALDDGDTGYLICLLTSSEVNLELYPFRFYSINS